MHQRYVVIGLGITGYACVKYLAAQNLPVAVTDTRAHPPYLSQLQQNFPQVKTSIGQLDSQLLQQATTIVLSPGLDPQLPEIMQCAQQGKPIIGDIELFAQAARAPIIAITGTNAKSTVTTLVGLMAKAAGMRVQIGGNLGMPALDLLEDKAQLYVLELSSFQLETTYSLQPTVACVLNITPDHMDRYRDLAHYQQIKLRVYHRARAVVYNRDDRLTYPHPDHGKSNYTFTLQNPQSQTFGMMTCENQSFLAYESMPLLAVKDLPIKGKHYQANALAALAIGYSYGLSMGAMLQTLRTFRGLPHRCQLVREHQQVKWYNDSKGTNVGATAAAIEGLGSEIEGKIVLIVGGVAKNADFSTLTSVITRYVRKVILIGQAAPVIATILDAHVPYSYAGTLAEAIQQAHATAQAKDCVLLSPACASYDMFTNFEHRGEVFVDLVQQL